MKKTFFILLGALMLSITSCTVEEQEVNPSQEINTRSSKSDCDDFIKKINLLVPDTDEELSFFKNLKDPKEVDKDDVAEYVNLLGFEDVESLHKYIVELSKDDCMDKIISEDSAKRGNCEWNLFTCVLGAIGDYGHGTNSAFLEVLDFILDIIACATDYGDCVE